MLDVDAFWAWWQAAFDGCPPIGHRLRARFATRRWIRFHSLPGSKRYATDEAEYAELLHRHDAIATALFGHGAPIVMLEPERQPVAARWAAGRFHAAFRRVADDELDDLLLVSIERSAVFAPYDGGIDVIGADCFVCDSLGRDYRAWRSTHPSGL